MKALFDSNILIDYLNGELAAKLEIEQFSERYISIITYIEVLVGFKEGSDIRIVKKFLNEFEILNIDLDIAHLAIEIRKNRGLKVPDSLILASAEKISALLITRNTKDFPQALANVRIPYLLSVKN